MEISPEKKGRESEKDLENGKAESTGAVEVSVLCYKFFLFMDGPISRRLSQDLSYPLITTLQQEECTRVLSRNESRGMALSLCRSWK